MFQTLKKIVKLSELKKKEVFTVSALILCVALLDFLGIAIVFPLIQLISEQGSSHIFTKYNFLNLPFDRFFYLVISFVILIFLSRTAFVLVMQKFLINFALKMQIDLRVKILSRLASSSVILFSNQTRADLIQNTTTVVNHYTAKALLPTLRFLTDIIISVLLLTYLLSIYQVSTSIVIILICIGMVLFNKFGVQKSSASGKKANEAFNSVLDQVSSYVTGLIELIVDRKTSYILAKIEESSKGEVREEASNQFKLLAPKYILELVLVFFLSLALIYFVVSDINNQKAIAVVVTMLLVATKLLPAILNSIHLITNLKYTENSSNRLYEALNIPMEEKKQSSIKSFKSLSLREVSFHINEHEIFKNLSFKFNIGEKIAICGPSGSGKSTLLEVMLGLKVFSSGSVELNGNIIKKENLNLANIAAYVPQNPMLFNGTLRENIFFDDTPITDKNLKILLKKVRLQDRFSFDSNEPIIEYDAKNLSGGEKQRIVLMRALTRDKDMIILDEITSSLDRSDAINIVNEIMTLFYNKTIVMITHDPKIANLMDRIVWMK